MYCIIIFLTAGILPHLQETKAATLTIVCVYMCVCAHV